MGEMKQEIIARKEKLKCKKKKKGGKKKNTGIKGWKWHRPIKKPFPGIMPRRQKQSRGGFLKTTKCTGTCQTWYWVVGNRWSLAYRCAHVPTSGKDKDCIEQYCFICSSE